MIRILIVDDMATTRENLNKLLSFESDLEVCGMASDGRQAIEEAHRLRPDIVLMDGSMPVLDGIQATERLATSLPGLPVILMSVQGDREYLRRAMQAGAREFLLKPFSHDEVVAAVHRVHDARARAAPVTPPPPVAPPLPAPAAPAPLPASSAATPEHVPPSPLPSPAPPPTPRSGGPGELIVVFSGKGGVGKTLIATNMAVALATTTRARVALVDLDLQFGDIGVMLNLDHTRTITDLVENADRLDAEMLNDFLASGPEGVRILLAPLSPELADLVTNASVRAILDSLRAMFDYVVVDTSSHLAELNIELIEAAQRVLVVSSLTIPAIKDAKLTLRVLESLAVVPAAVSLVINRTDPYSEFNRASIERNLLCPVSVQIPYEPDVVGDAVTRGVPVVTASPSADVSRAVGELVQGLVPTAGQAAAAHGADAARRRGRKGLFSR